MRARIQHGISLMSLLFTLVMVLSVSSVFAQATTHVVRPGENLYRIAESYGISVSALAEANDIAFTWRIYAGQTLIIPVGSDTSVTVASNSIPTNTNITYHTVMYGESLGQIARRYNLTPDQLAALNNITNPNLIYAGQQLLVTANAADSAALDPSANTANAVVEPALSPVIPGFSVVMPPSNQPQAETLPVTEGERHVVSYGESLSGIANRYGVSMLAITQANNIYDVNTIFVGQELIIPPRTAQSPADMGISTVAAAPPPRLTIGREIIVDLSEQRVYAYENGVLVRNVLVSTGLPATPTVQGSFTVQRKYAAQTMSGPGYYLPDVPYILYFYSGYALHGTYWHNSFGQPMSHGCVNLPTPEAEWFYNWADVGTPVFVQV